MAGSKKTVKKRKVVIDANGFAYVKSTFNNIIVSITNSQGQVISWSSAGKMGFRGSKKNTPYAVMLIVWLHFFGVFLCLLIYLGLSLTFQNKIY